MVKICNDIMVISTLGEENRIKGFPPQKRKGAIPSPFFPWQNYSIQISLPMLISCKNLIQNIGSVNSVIYYACYDD